MKWYQKAGYVTAGVALTLLAQFGYNAITGPDLVYKNTHFGNPSQPGKVKTEFHGAFWNPDDKQTNWLGGNMPPETFEDMVNDAVRIIIEKKMLEQIGTSPSNGISELTIEIKK